MKPCWENVFWHWLQKVFASYRNLWTMSDTINILNLFLAPLWRHCSQNISPHDCQRIPVDLYGLYIAKLVVFIIISGVFYKKSWKIATFWLQIGDFQNISGNTDVITWRTTNERKQMPNVCLPFLIFFNWSKKCDKNWS